METWKRGLLRAWLALSLIWSAGLTFIVVKWTMAEFAGTGWGFYMAVIVAYVLPLGAIPPFVILFLGWIIVACVDFWVRRAQR